MIGGWRVVKATSSCDPAECSVPAMERYEV